jgi:hypothetical protein
LFEERTFPINLFVYPHQTKPNQTKPTHSTQTFSVERAELVGTEPIPGATYCKPGRGGATRRLPVLPSDHFGVFVTLAPSA